MVRIPELMSNRKTISFEFFPPKTPKGATKLAETLDELNTVRPSFYSVTYGAAGSDRARTADAAVAMQQERNIPTMAHLTCVGHRRAEIQELCDHYAANGIANILALGGDLPADGSTPPEGDFRFATDLVEFLQADGRFSIGVAVHPEGHPRSSSLADDRQRLARKLDMADFGITQFFFEKETYLHMVDELDALGCDKPVIPGVIPITNANQVERFAAMAGATIPSWLTDQIDGAAPEEVAAIGTELAAGLAQELLDAGAPGVHLYTLNSSGPATIVAGQLSTPSS